MGAVGPVVSAAKSAYAAADDDVHRAQSVAPAVIIVVTAPHGFPALATGFVMHGLALFLLWRDMPRLGIRLADLGRFMRIDAGLLRRLRESGVNDG